MPEEPQLQEAPEQDQPQEEVETFTDLNTEDAATMTPEQLVERYDQMQADYTRKTQEVAEQRKSLEALGINSEWIEAFDDPEDKNAAVAWFLEQHGFLDDEDDDDDDDDFDFEEEDLTAKQVAELKARLDEREQNEVLDTMSDHLVSLVENAEVKPTQRQFEMLMREAYEQGPSPAATQRVFDEWINDATEFKNSVIADYSKRKDAPPPPAKTGASGTPHNPVSDDKSRLDRMNEIAQRVLSSG